MEVRSRFSVAYSETEGKWYVFPQGVRIASFDEIKDAKALAYDLNNVVGEHRELHKRRAGQ